jgi:histidine triad (HIT) family protein
MSAQECVFCKIISGQIPCEKIFENEHVLAFLDIGPISEGHTLIVPKQHVYKVDQTDPDVMAEVAKVIPMLAGSIQKAMDADGYNVLCNNGSCAGQVVEHVHFHIIPRKTNDGVFNRWPSFQYPGEKAAEVANAIRKNISR